MHLVINACFKATMYSLKLICKKLFFSWLLRLINIVWSASVDRPAAHYPSCLCQTTKWFADVDECASLKQIFNENTELFNRTQFYFPIGLESVSTIQILKKIWFAVKVVKINTSNAVSLKPRKISRRVHSRI